MRHKQSLSRSQFNPHIRSTLPSSDGSNNILSQLKLTPKFHLRIRKKIWYLVKNTISLQHKISKISRLNLTSMGYRSRTPAIGIVWNSYKICLLNSAKYTLYFKDQASRKWLSLPSSTKAPISYTILFRKRYQSSNNPLWLSLTKKGKVADTLSTTFRLVKKSDQGNSVKCICAGTKSLGCCSPSRKSSSQSSNNTECNRSLVYSSRYYIGSTIPTSSNSMDILTISITSSCWCSI